MTHAPHDVLDPQRDEVATHPLRDVVIVGGGAAGLAAALQLARSRRSVVVVDAGAPRNAPAVHMHGYLGHEGLPPGDFLAIARAEVTGYGAEIIDGTVTTIARELSGDAEGSSDAFRVTLDDGATLTARRVLLATGLVDELPDIPGVVAQWGRGVIHCPYCHGWEVRDRAIVVVATSPLSAHQALLFRQLSERVSVVEHEPGIVGADDRRLLLARGVRIEAGPVAEIVVHDGLLHGVRLAAGPVVRADAVTVSPRVSIRTAPFETLGVRLVDAPMGVGEVVEADERGVTSVPGVYAAGNVADPGQQVLHAAAHGSRVGAMINADLAHDDAARAAALGADGADDWDRRYGARTSAHHTDPDDTLVTETAHLSPGTAVDVCCGEGANAIWLARQGWDVTGVDISQVALDRAADAAADAGVDVTWIRADLTVDPLPSAAYDLVTTHYPALRHTADDHALRLLVDAVAPGGTLLVVHHLPPADHGHDGHHEHGFRAGDYLQPADVAARLGDGWTIEVDETRPRAVTPGHGGAVVPDAVLRARRNR